MTYSSSVALSRRSGTRRNRNITVFGAQTGALGPVSNTVILIVLACLIGLLYLTQVTKTNSYGYTINALQQQQLQLQNQKADLEVASARLQSLERIQNSSVARNMVSTTPSSTLRN